MPLLRAHVILLTTCPFFFSYNGAACLLYVCRVLISFSSFSCCNRSGSLTTFLFLKPFPCSYHVHSLLHHKLRATARCRSSCTLPLLSFTGTIDEEALMGIPSPSSSFSPARVCSSSGITSNTNTLRRAKKEESLMQALSTPQPPKRTDSLCGTLHCRSRARPQAFPSMSARLNISHRLRIPPLFSHGPKRRHR